MISAANGHPPGMRARLEEEFEKFLYLHGVRRSQQTILWFATEFAAAPDTAGGATSADDIIATLGGNARDARIEDMSQWLAGPLP